MTLEEISNHKHLEHVPIFLMIDDELKKQFKTDFQIACPEIYADIESLYMNGPECSCAKKVKQYAANNISKIAKLVYAFFEKIHRDPKDFLNSILVQQPKDNVAGKVFKTTIEKWPEFSLQCENYDYRSFSVVKEQEELYVFFL